MYKITWNDPLGLGGRNSIVEFFIGDKKYYGKIHEDNRKWFIFSFTSDLLHEDFVDSVFKPLGMSPKEYYKHVLGPDFDSHGKWPVASPGDFCQVLVNMRRDYEKINESEKKNESQLTSNNQLKIKENGNAIKLQRTKASIRRGKVPAGSRICSKIHKAAVSSQHLGYKQVIG